MAAAHVHAEAVGLMLDQFDVADQPTCLADDERAGGNIPRPEMLFPITVEATGCDVTQVERRRSKAPHGTRTAEKRAEHRHQIGGVFVNVVGKPGDQQRIDQFGRRRHMQPLTVEKCSRSALGRGGGAFLSGA